MCVCVCASFGRVDDRSRTRLSRSTGARRCARARSATCPPGAERHVPRHLAQAGPAPATHPNTASFLPTCCVLVCSRLISARACACARAARGLSACPAPPALLRTAANAGAARAPAAAAMEAPLPPPAADAGPAELLLLVEYGSDWLCPEAPPCIEVCLTGLAAGGHQLQRPFRRRHARVPLHGLYGCGTRARRGRADGAAA
jgi:hypothetical protein